MPIPGLKTRQPTGAVPYPTILLEGEEKAGKTWAAALLSASDKVGATYWLDLGEGAADEYGAIPGARYEIIEHDGSYAALANAVQAVKAEAKRAAAAGEKPTVLVLDTGSALWDGLKDWVDQRARKTNANKRKLQEDPDAEVKAPNNMWNDARSRWNRVMNPLLTFPGIVVVTSQGRETIKIGKDGRPIEGEKTWRVAVQEGFPYAVNVWVRMFRDANPVVVGARSVHLGIVPGKDAEREIKDPKAKEHLLEWLVFEALKCDPAKVTVRDLQHFSAGELTADERVDQDTQEAKEAGKPAAQQPAGRTPEEWLAGIKAVTSRGELRALHGEIRAAGQLTQGLQQAMTDRAGQLPDDQLATVVQAAQGRPRAQQQPAEQPAAAPEDDTEALAAEAEQRGMLRDELAMIAEITGLPVARLTARKLPKGVDEASTADLQSAIAGLRLLAINKLREEGRTAEADTYAQVGDTEYDIPAKLLGEADKAA